MINSRSQTRIAEIMANAIEYIDTAPDYKIKKIKRNRLRTKEGDGRANNRGYGYKRPIVVIIGKERFEFPSINSCAHSQMFRCSTKQIRYFAESGKPAGDRMVYYKDQLPEGLR